MNDSDQGDFINTLAMSQQEHCIILIILICADEGTLRTDRKLYYKLPHTCIIDLGNIAVRCWNFVLFCNLRHVLLLYINFFKYVHLQMTLCIL